MQACKGHLTRESATLQPPSGDKVSQSFYYGNGTSCDLTYQRSYELRPQMSQINNSYINQPTNLYLLSTL